MKLSLRWSISLLFAGAVVLVTALSTAYGVGQASDSVRDSIVERQQKSGAGAATGLEYFLDSTMQALSSTAALVSAADLQSPGANNVGPLLDPLIANGRDFSSAALLDERGEIVLVRPTGAPRPSLGFAALDAFQHTRAVHAPTLAFVGGDGGPAWFVEIPQRPPDAGPHFLVGRLSTNFLEDLLFSNLEPSSTGLILDADDHVVSTTDPAMASPDVAGWPALDLSSDAGASAVEAASPVDGQPLILTSSATGGGYPGRIVVMTPKDEVEQLQSDLIRSAILIAGVLATVAVVIGIVATNIMLRPVGEVRTATHRMREGDLAVRARPRGALEFRELAEDFNAMANSLSSEWEQRVALQNRLEELVEERTQQLNKRQEDMELFFYGVSHDFKSPVISISNITQMLEEELDAKRLDKDQLREFSRRIRNSSLSLQTLIGELLEFAQAERVAPKYQFTNTRTLVAPVIDEAQAQAKGRDIRIEARGAQFVFETDPERVRHILSNLVSNAIKYMPEQRGGWVRIEWERADGTIVMRVSDNGDGIPAGIQQQLFRPFSRYAPAGSKVAGAGLGLSIVKRLTESLRGKIDLATRARGGTTFTVTLPLKRPVGDRRGKA